MSNELLIIFAALFDLSIVLIAFRLGKSYVIGVIVVNLIMVSLAAPKVGLVFGVVGSPQTIFYASIFLGTDLLAEFHGKKSGYPAIWVGFLALALLAIFGQVVMRFQPVPDAEGYGNAFSTLFGSTWRVALGSFVAYFVAQQFDIWLFHSIKEKTEGRHLWLRNILSTSTSQFIDTLIFFPIAFLGVIPELLSVMMVAYVLKFLVALADTPFIYLARRINVAVIADQ